MIFGKGTEKKVGEELKAQGATRVLLVYGGSSIKRSGLYDVVIEAVKEAGLFLEELPGVVPNPGCLWCGRGSRSVAGTASTSFWP